MLKNKSKRIDANHLYDGEGRTVERFSTIIKKQASTSHSSLFAIPMIIGGLIIGKGVSSKNKSDNSPKTSRRDALKLWAKAGALGLVGGGLISGCSSGSSSSDCTCQNVGNCGCDAVCSCNSVYS